MTRHIVDEDAGDKPLDPAVERVRRKLVRFAIVNLLILFAALAVVVAALAWRNSSREGGETSPAALVEASLALPAGAKVLSHALSAEGVSLLVELAEGGQAVLVFGRADGRPIGRYRIAAQP